MLAVLCIQVRLRVFRGLRGTGFEPVGRDGRVVVASRSRPYGSVIESGWGRDFPHRSRAAVVPIHLPTQWVRGQSRWQSDRSVALTSHSHLAPSLKKSRIIPLHLLWNFVTCYRGNFVFLWI